MASMFYDVPAGIVYIGLGVHRIRYAIFSDPFDAMSYAYHNRHLMPGLGNLVISRRKWDSAILEKTPIIDCKV